MPDLGDLGDREETKVHLESRYRYTVYLGNLERVILGLVREDSYSAGLLEDLQLSLETKLLAWVPSCGFRHLT